MLKTKTTSIISLIRANISRVNSKTVLFVLFIFCLVQFFSIKRWNVEILWDHEMKSYYAYLPATFILGDPTLEKTVIDDYYKDHFYWPQPGAKRGHTQKTTMGVAWLQMPFFLASHVVALLGNFPANGYSLPYKIGSVLGAIFYMFLGLIFIRKALIRFFPEGIVIWTFLSLFLATNLYYYSFYEGQMSHVYSFFLVSALVYFTVSWHSQPKIWKMLLLGFLLGIITLIRPINICLVFFPLLYRDPSQESLVAKYKLVFVYWKSVVGAAVFFLLAIAPQLIYWKHTTGNWLFYSYGDQHLFWLRPKILLGLFSYQKGWLVWTPIGWFAVLGILFLRKEFKYFLLPVLVCTCVYIYAIFCWWCWWYGGGFGMRAMIDILPILAIPMAAFLRQVSSKYVLAIPILALSMFLVKLNFFQTDQYVVGRIHWAGTTKKSYWLNFMTNNPKEDPNLYNQEPNIQKALQGETGLD